MALIDSGAYLAGNSPKITPVLPGCNSSLYKLSGTPSPTLIRKTTNPHDANLHPDKSVPLEATGGDVVASELEVKDASMGGAGRRG